MKLILLGPIMFNCYTCPRAKCTKEVFLVRGRNQHSAIVLIDIIMLHVCTAQKFSLYVYKRFQVLLYIITDLFCMQPLLQSHAIHCYKVIATFLIRAKSQRDPGPLQHKVRAWPLGQSIKSEVLARQGSPKFLS